MVSNPTEHLSSELLRTDGTRPDVQQLSLLEQRDGFTAPLGRSAQNPSSPTHLSHHRQSRVRSAAALPYQAARGDLFRELAEQDQAAATTANPDAPTPQLRRSRAFRSAAAFWEFQGRKKPKGPAERLRSAVGYNRYCEFESRLNHFRGLKGKSLSARYTSLLTYIGRELDDLSTDFRHTASWYDASNDPTRETRDRLARARADVAELPRLLEDMAELYLHLHGTKRYVACPPPPKSPEEQEALRLERAQRQRHERVEVSRKHLRELTAREKLTSDSIRRGVGWISLDNVLWVLDRDLTGYGRYYPEVKPLWPSVPSIEQLTMDYQIGKKAAAQVLAAYPAYANDASLSAGIEPARS